MPENQTTPSPRSPPQSKPAPSPKPQVREPPSPFRSIKTVRDNQRIKQFLNQYRENEQTWAYTETALTIFLVAVFVFFAIRPAVITVTGLLSEIQAKEELVLKIRKKINSVVQAQDSYAQVQSRHQILEAFLPDSPRYAHTAAQVQGASQDTSLNISQITFTTESKTKKTDKKSVQSNVTPVVFTTSTKAKYQDLLSFLNQIFKNRRLIVPQQLNLSTPKEGVNRPEENLNSDQIQINLQGNSYFWNE
jgi:hypothetical protein